MTQSAPSYQVYLVRISTRRNPRTDELITQYTLEGPDRTRSAIFAQPSHLLTALRAHLSWLRQLSPTPGSAFSPLKNKTDQ